MGLLVSLACIMSISFGFIAGAVWTSRNYPSRPIGPDDR